MFTFPWLLPIKHSKSYQNTNQSSSLLLNYHSNRMPTYQEYTYILFSVYEMLKYTHSLKLLLSICHGRWSHSRESIYDGNQKAWWRKHAMDIGQIIITKNLIVYAFPHVSYLHFTGSTRNRGFSWRKYSVAGAFSMWLKDYFHQKFNHITWERTEYNIATPKKWV